jgi:hypothetical protein
MAHDFLAEATALTDHMRDNTLPGPQIAHWNETRGWRITFITNAAASQWAASLILPVDLDSMVDGARIIYGRLPATGELVQITQLPSVRTLRSGVVA